MVVVKLLECENFRVPALSHKPDSLPQKREGSGELRI